jgi:hypothetical protein
VRYFYLFVVFPLAACGGGSSGSSGSSASALAALPLTTTNAELAQTHVLPAAGNQNWTLTGSLGSMELHLVGQRSFLAMVDLTGLTPVNPKLEVVKQGITQVQIPLNLPASFPSTEASGAKYKASYYSATVPASYVVPGISLRAVADNYPASPLVSVNVGLDSELDIRTLPFYVFGATDANSYPIATTRAPSTAITVELFAKWPVAQLNVAQHPAGRVDWPYMVIEPRAGAAAYRITNSTQQQDGFATMSSVLNVLGVLRSANGESATNNQYYAPLLMLNSTGSYVSPGGGLGGGHVGTGDFSYQGVFIHEQGHAFGLGHADDEDNVGNFPYAGGSLKGSAWGFDAGRQRFIPPHVPTTSSNYATCSTAGFPKGRQMDSAGRCVKQDPMQSGSGDQVVGDNYTIFTDFNVGRMQRYFEGATTNSAASGTTPAYSYSGGRVIVDSTSATGYSRWNSLLTMRVPVTPTTTQGAIFGFDGGLPLQRNVPVHSIVMTLSNAGTPNVTQIYPPLSYTGNLMRAIDPTSTSDLSLITPDTSTYYWYCRNGGCDYTVRVTYADSTTFHAVLQGGFRPFNQASGTPATITTDATNSSSYKVFGVNVPGSKAISTIELLSTPKVWMGMPVSPTVLASR